MPDNETPGEEPRPPAKDDSGEDAAIIDRYNATTDFGDRGGTDDIALEVWARDQMAKSLLRVWEARRDLESRRSDSDNVDANDTPQQL